MPYGRGTIDARFVVPLICFAEHRVQARQCDRLPGIDEPRMLHT